MCRELLILEKNFETFEGEAALRVQIDTLLLNGPLLGRDASKASSSVDALVFLTLVSQGLSSED